MKLKNRWIFYIIFPLLFSQFSSATEPPQENHGVKSEFKEAGHSMKEGFKSTGRGIKKGAKKTGRSFKKAGKAFKDEITQ